LKVERSNRQLSEQLRRLLDEAYRAESRRIREISAEIKHLAMQLHDEDAVPVLLEMEETPQTNLIMERALFSPSAHIVYDVLPEDTVLIDAPDIGNLVDYFYVDPRRLREQIELALEQQDAVTLTQLLDRYPLQQGLSELVAYMDIAVNDPRHVIDTAQMMTVFTPAAYDIDDYALALETPQIVFHRTWRQST
jgi:hypothetical protein